MQCDDFADQCEAQAGAFRCAVGAGEGEEALEQALVGIVGDTGALVLHTNGDLRGVGAGGAGDRAADGGEVEGVLQQVGERQAQEETVAGDLQGWLGAETHLDLAAPGLRRERLFEIGKEFADV